MQFLIYAVGPITGYSYEEVTGWRDNLKNYLPSNYIVLSPMRGKLYLIKEQKIADSYEMHQLSTAKAITRRDYFDCNRCDLILCNFLGAKKVSIGSVMEIAWGYTKKIPIVVMMEKDNIHQHAMINECADFVVDNFEEGVDIVKHIIGVTESDKPTFLGMLD